MRRGAVRHLDPLSGSAITTPAAPRAVRKGIIPHRVWMVGEALLALGMTIAMFWRPEQRALLAAILGGLGQAIASFPALVSVDPGATSQDAAILLLAVALIVLPPLRYFIHARRVHLLWVPLWLAVLTLVVVFIPLGLGLIGKRIALLCAAAIGWTMAPRRHVGWLAFAPMLVAVHPTATTHGGPIAGLIWPPTRLMSRCVANDGVRPRNFSREHVSLAHYALTPIDATLFVMTGEGESYLLRRDTDGHFVLDGAFKFAGNLWQGSVGAGEAFFTHRGSGFISVLLNKIREPGGFTTRLPPFDPEAPELDMLDAVYEPTTRSVFATELVRGGAWELSLDNGAMRHHDVNAFYLQMVRRDLDAMLVGISTTALLVFDPRRGVVTERTAAAIGAGGVDVCQRDGTAAVTDYAGRLRLFSRSPSGTYRFERGVSLSSPRRVAFSPDCTWIAVTSGDDEHAYVLRRDDLSIWRTFRLGPGLRDVVYTAPREVAIVDACTVNIVPGGEQL